MKILFGLCVLALFTSCSSNLTYNREKNCSKRALEVSQSPTTETEMARDNYEQLQSFIKTKLSPEVHQCYQAYLDKALNPREFAVCTVTKIENGKVVFVDADDQVNLINDDVKSCIENKISKANWSFLKQPKTVTINQPFILHATRK